MTALTAAAYNVLTGVIPNPTPEAPPGSEPILQVLNWVSWLAIIVSVAGFIVAAGGLAFAHHSGREMNNFKGLAFAILAAILIGGVGAIMQIFV
ncbi:hypothetical protein [uncultured Cellulomonas sp.]|uniref:hypothetical protein n=1 Tax=uncultured Cellulomonas sp. TaxID=189682 RepID=UPI002635897A|nr:hypothetical protein [uncultured Cellulomonas sp.]